MFVRSWACNFGIRAWATLIYEWRRFQPAVLAVAFAGLLVLVPLALLLAMFATTSMYITIPSLSLLFMRCPCGGANSSRGRSCQAYARGGRRLHAGDGAICVKTIFERDITPTVEEVRALVATAHDEAREIPAAIVRDDIGYQPTTQVLVGLLDMLRTDYLARADVADAHPAALIDVYATQAAAGGPERLRSADIDLQSRLRGTIGRATEVTHILAEADAHLLFGSDTPSDLIYTIRRASTDGWR